ncbi:MAG: hypothetical protein ABI461_14610, partial [Polyangiaceae bacterium]
LAWRRVRVMQAAFGVCKASRSFTLRSQSSTRAAGAMITNRLILPAISRIFAGLALLTLFAACSSSNGDDDDLGGLSTHADGGAADASQPDANDNDASSASEFVNAYCGYITSCCNAEGSPSSITSCTDELLGLGADDITAEATCLASVKERAASDPSWCAHQTMDERQVCDLAILSIAFGEPKRGKLGDTCGGNVVLEGPDRVDGATDQTAITCYEIDGLACRITADSTPKCVALGKVGDACSDSEAKNCAYGAYCDATTSTCATDVADGQSCAGEKECFIDDFCASPSAICQERGKAGAPCQEPADCESGQCGATCEPGIELGNVTFCGAP